MKVEKRFLGKDRDKAADFVNKLHLYDTTTYSLVVHDIRALSQNALYNTRVRELANHFGETFKRMKLILKLELGLCHRVVINGEQCTEWETTADFTPDQMDSYLNQIEQWALDKGYQFKQFRFKIGR